MIKGWSLKHSFIWSAISLGLVSLAASDRNAVASPHPGIRPIDLSYNSHLPEADLLEEIRKYLEQQSAGDPSSIIEVDTSASSLRDDGLVQLIDEVYTIPCTIHLVAQRNRLTPRGACRLLDQLMKKSRTSTMVGKDCYDETSETTDQHPFDLKCRVESLDLSWNKLGQDMPGSKAFCSALEKLVRSLACCPRTIKLDRCGIGASVCRAIAKGLMHRIDKGTKSRDDVGRGDEESEVLEANIDTDGQAAYELEPLSLSLSGNSNIGNAGLAALAAAMRTIITKQSPSNSDYPVFRQLDLSSCGIGDVGMDALVMALEKASGMCVNELNLSYNSITDTGASALARAVTQANVPCIQKLNLSGNSIGDKGMADLAEAISSGRLNQLQLRSCQVQADGAAALGTAIALANGNIDVDLSGNPIGVLRGKSKTDGGKYSASRLKSKASATAASYVSQGMGFLRKGLKEVGMENVLGAVQLDSAESDDEEEAAMGADVSGVAKSTGRCGIKALANAFIDEVRRETSKKTRNLHIRLGLRQCFLDHAAADALAAMIVTATAHGINLDLDLRLNSILEDDMVAALERKQEYQDQLTEMAERHLDALEAVRGARERAISAASSAVDRSDNDLDATWDLLDNMEDQDEADEVWDSDADYEDA